MGFAGPGIDVDDLGALERPVLVVAGDDDVVDHHHTVEIFEALPDARLAIIPGTSHVLAHERPEALVALVDDFLHGDPPRRSLPMRTASG
jgi:pimeloyl-ACP methyl ester carboxylesterase